MKPIPDSDEFASAIANWKKLAGITNDSAVVNQHSAPIPEKVDLNKVKIGSKEYIDAVMPKYHEQQYMSFPTGFRGRKK